MRFFLSSLPNIPSTRRSAHSVFAAKRAHSATNNTFYQPGPSVWVFPEIYQIGRGKNKTPQHIPYISRTLATLIGCSAMTLSDSSFSPAFQSMQAENGSSDKRCPVMTDHFLGLVPDETIVPRALGGSTHTTGRRQYRWAKANKDVLCGLLFLCDVFFNFLRGGRRLPYLRLFMPANSAGGLLFAGDPTWGDI